MPSVRADYYELNPNPTSQQQWLYPGFLQPTFPCLTDSCDISVAGVGTVQYSPHCLVVCPLTMLIPLDRSDPYFRCHATWSAPGRGPPQIRVCYDYYGDCISCGDLINGASAPPPPIVPPEPSTGGLPWPPPIPPQVTALPWSDSSTGGASGSTGVIDPDLPPEPVHPFPYGTYNASDPSNTLHWMVGSSLNDYGGDPNALIREDCNTAILLAELWCDHYYSIEAQQQAWYMCFTDVLVDYMGFTSNTLPINYTTAYYDLSKDERVGPSWATILGTVLNPFASVADLIDDFLNDLRDDTNGRLTWWSEYTAFATGLSFQVNYVTVTNTSATLATSSWVYRGDWSIEQAVDVAVFTWRPVATEQTADIHETVSVAAAVLTYEAELWNKNDGALRQSILNMLGAAVQYRINSLPGLPT